MTRLSKLVYCLLISGLLLITSSKDTRAFGLPPMPPDMEVDFLTNASKIVSQAQAYYSQYQSIQSQIKSGWLTAIKGLVKMGGIGGIGLDKKGLKTVGKGEIKSNSTLGISAGEIEEEALMNAYFQLFFKLPSKDTKIKNGKREIKYEVLQKAQHDKLVEYQQDTIMETYLSSKLMEDYLNSMEETLRNLENCQKGNWATQGLDETKCTFFGVKMVDVESLPAPEDAEEDEAGQMGAATNAYVVASVYDRLLRVVEDLTAVEAIFRSSQQLEIVDPIGDEQQSSAEEYIGTTYKYVYKETQDFVNAKALVSQYKRSEACGSGTGGINCPQINKDKTELEVIEDTSILTELRNLEDKLAQAMRVHNLKAQLMDYKTQYRYYLQSKNVWDKTREVLKQSDNCVVNFLDKHIVTSNQENNEDARIVWYGGKGIEPTYNERNDYANRINLKGLSGKLISEYDVLSTNIAIGTVSELDGYYEEGNCPSGYVQDTKNKKEVDRIIYYPCVVETVASDISKAEPNFDFSKSSDTDTETVTVTDGVIEPTKVNEIETENRKQAELTWRLGHEKIVDLATNGYEVDEANTIEFKFDPWQDQKVLQYEYMRNKYRNIRLIIESLDQGDAAYKLAAEEATGDIYDEENIAQTILNAIAKCEHLDKAKEIAHNKYCQGYANELCVSQVEGSNIVTRFYTKDSKGKKVEIPSRRKVEPQITSVSNANCTYKVTTPKTLENTSMANILTVEGLVKAYFKDVLAENGDFYTTAKGKGREVATDYLASVINERILQDEKMKAFISQYNDAKKAKEKEIKELTSSLKGYNLIIDNATKFKNKISEELAKTQKRQASIGDTETHGTEIYNLTKKNKKTAEDKCAIAQQIEQLNYEQACITSGNKDLSINCPKECKDKEIKVKNIKNCSNIRVTCLKTQITIENDSGEKLRLEAHTYNGDTYILPKAADKALAEQSKIIEAQTEMQRIVKDKITALQEELQNDAEEFAENYIKKAEEAQTAIEDENKKFESFLEKQDTARVRMRNTDPSRKICIHKILGICNKKGPETYEKDNLETVSTKIYSNATDLETAIKEQLNNKYFGNLTNLANSLSLTGNVYLDNELSGLIKKTPQTMGVTKVISELKDILLDRAAEKASGIIGSADSEVEKAIEAALNAVDSFAGNNGYKVSGETNRSPNPSIFSTDYSTIIQDHKDMIAKLRNIESGLGIENFFGIPDNIEATDAESEYFVGLPARPNNYRGINSVTDKDAGKDYAIPVAPSVGLPPLREMFYFNGMDYDDIPQNKKGQPAISQLLNCKYYAADGKSCDVEYMPEVWRQLLARPNLRNDGKYQQTFVERSFAKSDVEKLIKNMINNMSIPGAKLEHYNTILARSGVYPCVTQDGMIVDIQGAGEVVDKKKHDKLPFAYSSLGVNKDTLPVCQEITTSTQTTKNPCRQYNSKNRDALCHLLADHGKEKVADSQKSLDPTTNGLYKGYSELGQFLTTDLGYQPLQRSIHEFLLNKNPKKSDANNSITRKKAEQASFKRNILGSFLDAVTAEHNAHKMFDTNEQAVKEALETLCTAMDENNISIAGVISPKPDASSEKINECVEAIMNRGGLALSAMDDEYDPTEKCKGTIYNELYCLLDNTKNALLAEVKQKRNGIVNKDVKPIVAEYLNGIDNDLLNLEKDNGEMTSIQPDMDTETLTKAIKEAKAKQITLIDTANEAIISMANQSQTVAYCPIY